MSSEVKPFTKKHYITSLKGVACLLVALGHFIGTLKYASVISLNTQWLDFLNKYRMAFLVNESFYLYLFFVISGYLIAHSKVASIKDATIRAVLRFLRLAIPVMASSCLIFLISKIIPFQNGNTAELFENAWLQSAYAQSFSFLDVLRSPIDVLFLRRCVFNSPFWVLSYMLVASFLTYGVSYIRSKLNSEPIKLLIALFLTCASLFLSKVIFSCMVGSLLCYYEKQLSALHKSKLLIAVLGAIAFALCFVNYIYGAIVFFSWLMVVMPKLEGLRRAFEIAPLKFLGDISFGIYSFHWPIFCSLGCLLLTKLWGSLGGGVALLISILVSTVTTIALAVVFRLLAEKPSDRFLAFLKNKLYG